MFAPGSLETNYPRNCASSLAIVVYVLYLSAFWLSGNLNPSSLRQQCNSIEIKIPDLVDAEVPCRTPMSLESVIVVI